MSLSTEAVKDGAGGKHLATPREDEVDGIDPALSLDANIAAVRTTGEDAGRSAGAGLAAVRSFELVSEVTSGEIEAAIRSEVRAVLIGASVEVHRADDLFALISDTIIVGVFEAPEVGRRNDVECTVVPESTFWHSHLVRKDGALVENAVPIGVEESAHKARKFLLDLRPGGEVASITLGDVEAASIIEAGHHGIFHQWWCGSDADLETVGDFKGGRYEFRRSILCAREQCPENQCADDQSIRPCEELARTDRGR